MRLQTDSPHIVQWIQIQPSHVWKSAKQVLFVLLALQYCPLWEEESPSKILPQKLQLRGTDYLVLLRLPWSSLLDSHVWPWPMYILHVSSGIGVKPKFCIGQNSIQSILLQIYECTFMQKWIYTCYTQWEYHIVVHFYIYRFAVEVVFFLYFTSILRTDLLYCVVYTANFQWIFIYQFIRVLLFPG